VALDLDLIRVIVYDLDGTVYSDTAQFEIYAHEIQSRLPFEVQPQYWAEYEAVLSGEHPVLRIGTFYDVDRDLILHPKAGRIERALHWDGSEVPPLVRESLYPDPVEPDQSSLMNVGDLWWVPTAISFHFGGNRLAHAESFLRVRTAMSQPDFSLRPIDGLQAALTGMRGKVTQVLATNSPQPDSEAILRKVGLLGVFDHMYFNSRKPAGLVGLFNDLAAEYGVGFQAILSIGDNLVNDIAPAALLGCQTIFIDPHETAQAGDADLIVPSMTTLLPFFGEMQRRRAQPA